MLCFMGKELFKFAYSSRVNLLNSASVSKVFVCGSLLGADAPAWSFLPSGGPDSIAESRMSLWTFGCKVSNGLVTWTSATEKFVQL